MLTLALLAITFVPQGDEEALTDRIRVAARVHSLGSRRGIVPDDRKCPYCREPLARLLLTERDTVEGSNRDVALICAEDGIGYLVGEGILNDGEAGPFALPENDAEARAGLQPFGARVIAPRRTMETDWNVVLRSPDLRYAAGGGHDPVLRVWSNEVLVEDRNPMGPTASAFSPKSDAFALARSGGKLLVWQLPSGRPRELSSKAFVNVSALAFDPAARHLAVLWYEGERAVLEIRAIAGGAVTARLDADGLGGVTHLSWSPDGRHLAAGDWDGDLRVWEVAGSRIAKRHAAGEPIRDLSWAAAGDHVALATGREGWTARVVELSSDRTWSLSAEPVVMYGRGEAPSIAIGRVGERFAWLLPDGTFAIGGVAEGGIRSHFGATVQRRIEMDGADGFRTSTADGRRIHWDPVRALPTDRIRRSRP